MPDADEYAKKLGSWVQEGGVTSEESIPQPEPQQSSTPTSSTQAYKSLTDKEKEIFGFKFTEQGNIKPEEIKFILFWSYKSNCFKIF